jgi:hypothetical protein
MDRNSPAFRLATPGSGGVACGEEGLFVGSTALLKRTHQGDGRRWRHRPIDELNVELSERYGVPVDLSGKLGGLRAVATALDLGDIVRAQIAALHLRMPDPPLRKAMRSGEALATLLGELRGSGLLAKYLSGEFDESKHPRWPAGSPDSAGG